MQLKLHMLSPDYYWDAIRGILGQRSATKVVYKQAYDTSRGGRTNPASHTQHHTTTK